MAQRRRVFRTESKNKPNLLGRLRAATKRFGLVFSLVPFVGRSSTKISPAWAAVFERLAFAAGATATARVGVGRGQHAQQGGATAGTTHASSPPYPGDGPGPFKPIMRRCVFLGFRIVHQTKLPRGETRPKKAGLRSTHSVGPRGTRIPPSTAVLASVSRSSAGLQPGRINSRWSGVDQHPPSLLHAQASDQNDRCPFQIAKTRDYHIGQLAI